MYKLLLKKYAYNYLIIFKLFELLVIVAIITLFDADNQSLFKFTKKAKIYAKNT